MTTVIEVAPLPIEQIDAERAANPTADAMWQSFGDNGTPFSLVGIRDAAAEKLNEMETIRTAHATAKARLADSETPEAQEYRQLKERAEKAKELATAKHAEELAAAQAALDAVKNQIAETVKAINVKLAEVTAKAIEAETGQVLGEADAEEKGREYKLIVDKFKGIRDVLIQNGVESLKKYTLPGLGAAKGTNKSSKASVNGVTGEQWRPRLQFATVDGVQVHSAKEFPTGTEVAKALGIALPHFQTALATELGGRVNVPNDHDVTFTVSVNDTDKTVVIRGRQKDEAKVSETLPAE